MDSYERISEYMIKHLELHRFTVISYASTGTICTKCNLGEQFQFHDTVQSWFTNKRRLSGALASQFNGLKFLQESSKKISHLFNAHMPRLTQIARSTVLHMQICFAWKSIWSCSKESRTALLLSLPTGSRGAPSCRRSPLAWKTFHQLHTQGHAASRTTVPQTASAPRAIMQISQAAAAGSISKQDNKGPRPQLFA